MQRTTHIVNIDSGDRGFLAERPISSGQFASWQPARLDGAGLCALLCSAFQWEEGETVLEHIIVCGPKDQQDDTGDVLAGYFCGIVSGTLEQIDMTEASTHVVVLNLMPFGLSKPQVDKLMLGLCQATQPSGVVPAREWTIVLLTRNIDWFLGSHYYAETVLELAGRVNVALVDLRGYYAIGVELAPQRLDRSLFHAVFQLSDKQLYYSLIYRTNSHIGHFELAHSHLRTHYDLTDFLEKDNVAERIVKLFTDQVADLETFSVVAVGMEANALWTLTIRLKELLSGRVVDVCGAPGLDEDRLARLLSNSQGIVVLTDIVNTGATVADVCARIAGLNGGGKPVRVFAIVSMKNSPPDVDGVGVYSALQLRRPYYERDPNGCPLCVLGQPLQKVRKVEDFRKVFDEQLTPLDFWEIVSDSKGLREGQPDHFGRVLLYRVETSEVLHRYGHWLRSVVKHKYTRQLPTAYPTS